MMIIEGDRSAVLQLLWTRTSDIGWNETKCSLTQRISPTSVLARISMLETSAHDAKCVAAAHSSSSFPFHLQ